MNATGLSAPADPVGPTAGGALDRFSGLGGYELCGTVATGGCGHTRMHRPPRPGAQPLGCAASG